MSTSRSLSPALALCVGALVSLGSASEAHANGQSTHLWITDHAITHVPPGPLADFLARPELRKMLENGTMFPDGGYAIDDPYAEIAHWEPFQSSYFDWIAQTHVVEGEALSLEGAEHLAFMLGMASHGMADQVFDSLYGERVKAYDGAIGDFDTASDIIMMSNFEPRMAPGDWVPYELFDGLYDQYGYDVDPARMQDGQMYLRIAVNSVAVFSQMPDQVAESAAPFPWGSQHLLDEDVPGAPPCEGEMIARYWRTLWALVHDQPLPGPVLGTIPADGGADHPTDSASLESWVSVVFARGLDDPALSVDSFHLAPEGGGPELPITLWHYYGQDAHVVHLRPQEDLAADTVYTVSVDPGVMTIHGEGLEGYTFRFSTGAAGPEPTVPEWPPDHDPNPAPGDGDGDEETDGEGEGEGSEGGDADAGDASSTGGPGEGSSTEGEAGLDDAGAVEGCSCAQGGELGGVVWTGLAALLGLGAGALGQRRREVT